MSANKTKIISAAFEALLWASIPFLIVAVVWLWGFATRHMLGWNGIYIIATIISVLIFGVKFSFLTVNTRVSAYVVAFSIGLNMLGISYLYESMSKLLAEQAATSAQEKAEKELRRQENEASEAYRRFRQRNFEICLAEERKGISPSKVPECHDF